MNSPIKITINSLAHDVPGIMAEKPSYLHIENVREEPANTAFPACKTVTLSVPPEEEGNLIAFLARFALDRPNVNIGCEKPARWIRFPVGTPQSCVTNVLEIEEDADEHYIRYLVSY